MLPTLYLTYSLLRARLDTARRDERGLTTTEIVVLTAVLVTLAFGAIAIISQTVLNKAESINLEGSTP